MKHFLTLYRIFNLKMHYTLHTRSKNVLYTPYGIENMVDTLFVFFGIRFFHAQASSSARSVAFTCETSLKSDGGRAIRFWVAPAGADARKRSAGLGSLG